MWKRVRYIQLQALTRSRCVVVFKLTLQRLTIRKKESQEREITQQNEKTALVYLTAIPISTFILPIYIIYNILSNS